MTNLNKNLKQNIPQFSMSAKSNKFKKKTYLE